MRPLKIMDILMIHFARHSAKMFDYWYKFLWQEFNMFFWQIQNRISYMKSSTVFQLITTSQFEKFYFYNMAKREIHSRMTNSNNFHQWKSYRFQNTNMKNTFFFFILIEDYHQNFCSWIKMSYFLQFKLFRKFNYF